MEEINGAGGNAGACHGQMYNMGTLLRHGSEAQKRLYLTKIASGELRLQSMGVTEPTTGTDTTSLKTTAVRKGDRYVVNGQEGGGWEEVGRRQPTGQRQADPKAAGGAQGRSLRRQRAESGDLARPAFGPD